ncbi:MAG: HEAT repeat domain-containing protein [Pirellulales bacterium]|nr:HEAT repeat domain-containing protein [Pirellulales bacterium]
MDQNTESQQTISPDDALPSVEPPSAGFILQLFVVPAVIVAIIVAVWLMFTWLAHMGDNPSTYINALRRDNEARWQAAVNLANALRQPNSKFKNNTEIADELAQLLQDELEASRQSKSQADVRVRVYICRALGEFNIPNGLPALLEAAKTQTSEADVPVRASAIEGIALLASGPAGEAVRANLKVASTLVECSTAEDPAVRTRAAFALGVIGGAEAQERLATLLKDPIADVRYNAATGLARLGDARAVDVLAEMLDPTRVRVIERKEDELAQEFKRFTIPQNALRAVEKLIDANPSVDVSALQTAMQPLTQSENTQLSHYAAQVAARLADRQPAQP